jgi:hypothetical protein
MRELAPFLILGLFGLALYFGAIIWTEWLFPEKPAARHDYEQRTLEFPQKADSRLVSNHD